MNQFYIWTYSLKQLELLFNLGNDRWIRTLLQGIGTVSPNSKYILTNQLDTRLILWDWKTSEIVMQLENIKNQESYHRVEFLIEDNEIVGGLFLDDDNQLILWNYSNGLIRKLPVEGVLQNNNNGVYASTNTNLENQNWKLAVSRENNSSKSAILYEHHTNRILTVDNINQILYQLGRSSAVNSSL